MEYAQEETVIIFFMREKKKNLVRLVGMWSSAEVGAGGSWVVQMPSGEPWRESDFSADGTRDCGWMEADHESQISKERSEQAIKMYIYIAKYF